MQERRGGEWACEGFWDKCVLWSGFEEVVVYWKLRSCGFRSIVGCLLGGCGPFVGGFKGGCGVCGLV